MLKQSDNKYSMRPITLSRIIDLCLLITSTDNLTVDDIAIRLRTTQRRAKEITSELKKMKLLVIGADGKIHATRNTKNLLDAFESEDWNRFRQYLCQFHFVFRTFINFMRQLRTSEEGFTLEQLEDELRAKALNLNRASIEVLANWGERIGILQRNAFTGRYYMVYDKSPSTQSFKTSFLKWYQFLNSERGLGLRQVYVEIPRLRECVCERLNISREVFDRMVLQLYSRNISNMELAGAPTTTVTKRSRFSIRRMASSIDRKHEILSPKIDVERYRKGIEMQGKMYFYIAIHNRLVS